MQNLTTPAQSRSKSSPIDLRDADWECLRQFALAADRHSFKSGAKDARCSVNTIRHNIETLERKIGQAVFRRSHLGLELTLAGEQLYTQVSDMRLGGTVNVTAPLDALAPNEVRLAITEGLGTFWIIPRLAEFQDQHPDMLLNLECKMGIEDLHTHACDIAVQLERPVDPMLVQVRLGTMHLMPFASQKYIKQHGVPSTIQEAMAHRFVLQKAEQVRPDLFELFAGSQPPLGMVAMQVNTSSAHYWAVAQGVGIGVLPTYSRAITKSVIPIDMEVKLKRDIWLVYHPDIKRSKLHLEAVAWLRSAFDRDKYPWFSDEFVHPNKFEAAFEGTNVIRLFAGFMDA